MIRLKERTEAVYAWSQKNSIGHVVLRVAMALVFLYFGINQLLDPARFVGWLPSEAALIPLSGTTIVLLNGILETVLGILLILGIYTRISAAVLGLHLLFISFTMGFTETAVRDFGLALATIAIAITGPDSFTMDTRTKRKKT